MRDSAPVARLLHKQKVAGSIPAPATMSKKEAVRSHVEFSPVQRHQDLVRYIKRLWFCAGKIAPNAVSDGEDRKEFRRRMYQELATAWMEIGKVSLELQIDEFGECYESQIAAVVESKETMDVIQ